MSSSSPQFARVRILVVDDFKDFRDLVSTILRHRPDLRIIGEAADGLEAVQKAIELTPDLILLDIGLPGLDGLEAAKRMHEAVPTAKIVFITMNSDVDVIRAALKRANGYVLKADAGRELLTAIDAVIQSRRFVSSGLTGRENSDCG